MEQKGGSFNEDDQPWHRIHATKSIGGEMTCLQIMHTTCLELCMVFCLFGAAVSLIQMFQIGNLRHRAASLKAATHPRVGEGRQRIRLVVNNRSTSHTGRAGDVFCFAFWIIFGLDAALRRQIRARLLRLLAIRRGV